MSFYQMTTCRPPSRYMLTDLQPAATLENLSRLASKPGVQSTLILSRSDGSIIRSTGFLAGSSSSLSPDAPVGNGTGYNDAEESTDGPIRGGEYKSPADVNAKGNTVHDVARMVFEFVGGANAFTEGMDKSDEVKLLRLRTRKNEIVIVPGRKVSRQPSV